MKTKAEIRRWKVVQGLIKSLEPLYHAIRSLCGKDGTWTGDIHAVRKKLGDYQIAGDVLTKRLNSLQRRGLVTFSRERVSHKRVIWTVTLVKQR